MKKNRIASTVEYLLLLLAFICVILLIIFKQNVYIIYAVFILIGLLLGLLISSGINARRQKQIDWLEERVKLTNSIAYRVKIAGEKAFTEIPIGIIVYDNSFKVEWANNYAKEIFLSPLVDRKLSLFDTQLESRVGLGKKFTISLYDHEYEVDVFRDDSIMFLRNRTELHNLEMKYFDRTQAAAIINLDNFEEALSTVDAQTRALRISDIIGLLSDWCQKYGIFIRGYSEKQYLVLMSREQLEHVMQDKFDVVDTVNEYCNNQGLKISISIGVACFDTSITNLMEKASEMLDFALNRGGNQAVSFVDEKISYFGGKEIGTEIRLPLLVRTRTEDLCKVIEPCKDVMIMSHSNADTDAFGASVALLKICRALNKDAVIVIDEDLCDNTVKTIMNEIKSEHIGMNDYFITPSKALSQISNDTLLILADVQYEANLMSPKVYRKAKNIAIIDHHRSSRNAISNYQYMYNKTTSSSSVELIVEMFDYIDEEINVSSIEASLMLLGILVDTNNLIYRTSAQTFAVMSKLQLYGAEMSKAQNYLREDLDSYKKRIEMLGNVNIVDDKFGISLCDNENIYTRPFIAKVADNIISLNSVKAGFCIGRISENIIGVSARSFDFNVQIIMEQLGGGGHFNNAATQIKDKTIAEVEEKLIEILRKDESDGEETMKIILTKDVKGKGKAGDIIDIPSGHANYLIKNKQAIVASTDNLNEYKRRSEQDKIEAQNLLEEMRKLKEFLESHPITIDVKVGKEGKLFGTVSNKQIVDEIKLAYNVVLDKRKIMYEKNIDSLGTYTIPIQLHKEVTANITLYVVEKKG